MYSVTQQNYGYLIAFVGSVSAEEMQSWLEESRRLLVDAKPGFGVLIDQRKLRSNGIGDEARKFQEEGQKTYMAAGMARCCVIYHSTMVDQAAKSLARQSGIDIVERYINADKDPNWRTKALAWIEKGVEPAAKAAAPAKA